MKRIRKIVFEDDSEILADIKPIEFFKCENEYVQQQNYYLQFDKFDSEILNHLDRDTVKYFSDKNFWFDCDCAVSDYSDSDIQNEAENRGIYPRIEGVEFPSIVTDDLVNRFIQFINKSGTTNAENVLQYLEKQFKI